MSSGCGFRILGYLHSCPRCTPVDTPLLLRSPRAAAMTLPARCFRQAMKKMIPRGLKKEQKEEMEYLEKMRTMLEEGKDIR